MSIKDKLQKRIEENYKTKDNKSFAEYNKIFNFPKEYKMFKPHLDKINQIVILPYIIKSDNDPNTRVSKGDSQYVLNYRRHSGVGINNETVLCLNQTFRKPCPICEELKILYDDYEKNKNLIKNIKVKTRSVFNVLDLLSDNPEEVMIFDTGWWDINKKSGAFEPELMCEIVDPDTKEYVIFTDPSEDGYIVKFRAFEIAGEYKHNEYKAFRFEKRKYAIKKEILDKVLSLDEYLIVPKYDEVKNIFLGTENIENKQDDDYLEKANEFPKQENKKSNLCPHGHTFKKDVDTTDDCIQCTEWEKCSEVE